MVDTRLEQMGAPAPARAPTRLRRVALRPAPLCRGDRLALGVLVLLPVLIIVPFALIGHPLLQGDNLTQNYPLRVLAGEELRAGHLPTWDSLIWSGTPLLAGWNAGALFPGTLLFAFLPHLLAWTLNQLVAPIGAGVGTFLLLRRLSCGPLAALIGGLGFAWTGFMSGQSVHLGLVQGTAFLPWTLLGIESIAAAARAAARWRAFAPGALTIGLSLALTVLAGDPRAVSTSMIVVAVYGLAHLVRAGWQVRRILGPIVAGGILAILCSAAQWWPGIVFLKSSQRGQTGFSAYTAGSLSLTHVVMNLALPFADGGNGNFSMPVYGGNYNLPEVTIGVGVLALVAFFAFLPELAGDVHAFWRRWRHEAAPAPGGRRRLGVWYVLAGVGLLLTLGGTIPLGHVFAAIPLFGGERLQNRNAVMIDLALVVLLAFLVDDLVRPARPAAEHGSTPALSTRASRLLGASAFVGVVGFAVFNVAFSSEAESIWGNVGTPGGLPGRNAPYWVAMAIVLSGIGAVVFAHHRVDARRRRLLVAGTAVLEIAVFIASANYATAPLSVLAGPTKQSAIVKGLAGPVGRYALYNPLQSNPTSDPQFLRRLGVPDINILHRSPSVQGYGSIVDGTYAAATASHTYEDLNVNRLASETFNSLDLSVLVTPPLYLYTVLPNAAPVPVGGGAGVTFFGGRVAGPTVPQIPLDASGPWAVRPRTNQLFQLGPQRQIIRVQLVLEPGTPAPSRVRVAFASAAGTVTARRTLAVHAGQARLVLRAPLDASVLRIENLAQRTMTLEALVVTTRHPAMRLLLDGHLQGLMPSPHWQYLSQIGPFLAFRNTATRGLGWLQRPGQHTPNVFDRAPGSVHTTLASVLTPETMIVHTPKPALLVRSVSYAPGWTARLVPLGGGPTRVLTVHRFGLIEVADLPAGDFRVIWRYSPRSVHGGLLLSGIGTLAALGGALVVLGERRRRRRTPATTPPVA